MRRYTEQTGLYHVAKDDASFRAPMTPFWVETLPPAKRRAPTPQPRRRRDTAMAADKVPSRLSAGVVPPHPHGPAGRVSCPSETHI